ncbi:hypothetical protein INS49_004373 [Diaporthe citri]|uniref:uncharacterized protein n=1 Tax=Diaporthe citri TaxID=83186 RepID=UPI001C7F75A2|nr:uncharacterized protein INS49_004373 [Diaporthe citri]KAG6354356.1 hypothetical protein INS49_004373 [Diaporthe citri]
MFATKALRQAAAHAERVPSIKFIGKRSIPSAVDHTPKPHPASPSQSLPSDFSANSFSEYRQRSQQYGPLQKTWARTSEGGIGGASGSALPSIEPGKGFFFDRDELPARFRRTSWTVEEIEAIESGGASAFA